mmetsp:Transcript_16569/g.57933  ORF Transcript_16569/g.57933 Transcript_16569/m.57933 type:complete len:629 (-) Transcript_16569:66-1952(-)
MMRRAAIVPLAVALVAVACSTAQGAAVASAGVPARALQREGDDGSREAREAAARAAHAAGHAQATSVWLSGGPGGREDGAEAVAAAAAAVDAAAWAAARADQLPAALSLLPPSTLAPYAQAQAAGDEDSPIGARRLSDPSLCTQYHTTHHECNCHSCNCKTCYDCACHVKTDFWNDCETPSCGGEGCWCSPRCTCCRNSDCPVACDCDTCCDTCTTVSCANRVTYSLHAVAPDAIAASSLADGVAVHVTGGHFVDVAGLRCRFTFAPVTGDGGSNASGSGGGGGGGATFRFTPEQYHFSRDVGTVVVNVTASRSSGGGGGALRVSYATHSLSAVAGDDFVPAAGVLQWPAGESGARSIFIEVLWEEGGRAEGTEMFEVVLSAPFPAPAAHVAGRNATVVLAPHGVAEAAGRVDVTVHLAGVSAAAIALDSAAGAQFAAGFAADVTAVLGVSASRLVVVGVQAGSGGAVVTFTLLPPPQGATGAEAATAAELASRFVREMSDPTSALYEGRTSHMLDMSFEPLVRESGGGAPAGQQTHSGGGGDGDGDSGAAGWIVLSVLLGLVAVAAGVAYVRRVALSEWLLWRLGNFRFRRFREGEGGSEGSVMEGDAPIGGGGRGRGHDDDDDTRL